ncbi:hypothetical protein JOD54_001622 [Actinokineospora baliensis]|uniref:hypothetical protein n=1 Tax=Actinokineospora baliensis TaxID=547056 RepID=UPI00195A96CF|nr:hypothetical protein [Actinokineospora baliensis]MBM7771418.1 hypothetical protein [Actinokineospora baliensis]
MRTITALLCLTLTGACGRAETGAAGSAPPTTPHGTAGSATAASAPPAQAKAVVSDVLDARTVLTSAGERVVVAGLADPGDCWRAPALAFARDALRGKEVRISELDSVRLSDGTDFARLALVNGMGKTTAVAARSLTEAQSAAQASAVGLWGPPCRGGD